MAKQRAIPKTKKAEKSSVKYEEDDDDERYYGSRKEDKRHGQGTYFFTNGDYYSGNWRKGRMEGQGKYVYANREREIGWFYKNKYVGEEPNKRLRRKLRKEIIPVYDTLPLRGLVGNSRASRDNKDNYDDDERYVGNLNKKRQFHGRGAYYYANGDYYSGNWRKGRREGQGEYVFKDGKREKGWFYKNEYVGVEPSKELRRKIDKGMIPSNDAAQSHRYEEPSNSDSDNEGDSSKAAAALAKTCQKLANKSRQEYERKRDRV